MMSRNEKRVKFDASADICRESMTQYRQQKRAQQMINAAAEYALDERIRESNSAPRIDFGSSFPKIPNFTESGTIAREVTTTTTKTTFVKPCLQTRRILFPNKFGTIGDGRPGHSSSSAGFNDSSNTATRFSSSEGNSSRNYKTALCKFYQAGQACGYGEQCKYAHGVRELRLPPQAFSNYKTQLCRHFTLTGVCPQGARCAYVHRRDDHQRMTPFIASLTVDDKPQPMAWSSGPLMMMGQPATSTGPSRLGSSYAGPGPLF